MYNNGSQFVMVHDNIAPTFPITNCVVDNNQFVSHEATQRIASFETVDNGIDALGAFDNNFYCRPLDDSLTIQLQYFDTASQSELLTLKGFQSKYNKDLHSGKSPIEVESYKVTGVKSNNFFPNAAFKYNTTNWSNWANYNNGKISLASGQGVTDNAMKAAFTSSSGKPDAYHLVISNSFGFVKGKVYRLKFAANGSQNGATLKLIPRKNGGFYNDVALPVSFVLKTTFTEYEFLLEASVTEPNSRIDFEIREGQGDVWFDNMELVEVEVEKTDPDKYIRFEYNDTKISKTVSLSDSYTDITGKPAPGSIVIKPFSSVILFKTMETSVGDLLEKHENGFDLFPNPATNSVWVKSAKTIDSVNLYDMNGLLVKSFDNIGTAGFKIASLLAPGIYIVQVQTNNKVSQKKLIISK